MGVTYFFTCRGGSFPISVGAKDTYACAVDTKTAPLHNIAAAHEKAFIILGTIEESLPN